MTSTSVYVDSRQCFAATWGAHHIRRSSNARRFPVSRVPLALNVNDLDESIAFYTKLFDTDGQDPPRLRQLRRRRAAAETGAHREPRPGRKYQPPPTGSTSRARTLPAATPARSG